MLGSIEAVTVGIVDTLGSMLGTREGWLLSLGLEVGNAVGFDVVGFLDGAGVGFDVVGLLVGVEEGFTVGLYVGIVLGIEDTLGSLEGVTVGTIDTLGSILGAREG
jgi:hypothetical protein